MSVHRQNLTNLNVGRDYFVIVLLVLVLCPTILCLFTHEQYRSQDGKSGRLSGVNRRGQRCVKGALNPPISDFEFSLIGPKYDNNMPPVSPGPYNQPVVVSSPPQPATHTNTVVLNQAAGGGCPVCRTGTLKKEFTCCAWCLAILCFPCGILCCLCMKHRKCNFCGAAFG